MLETFRLAKFRFIVCAKEHIRFPSYKGSAFRGGFWYAFKRGVFVIKGKECDDCLLKQKCIYSYIFETPPPEDTEILRLYPKVPHPFVIEPPITEKQTFEPGETFSFHLILIGNAIDYIPYFIYTFTELGKQGIGQGRGKYDLLHVEGMDLENEAIQIYDHKTQTLTNHYPIIHARQLNSQNPVPVNGQGVRTYATTIHDQVTAHNSPSSLDASFIEKERGGIGEEKNTSGHNQIIDPISSPCKGEDFVVMVRQAHHARRYTLSLSKGQSNDEGGVNIVSQKDTPQGNNHTNKITISLLTPLRLRFDGHITDKLEFHVLIRNLLRRISSLSYFHCNEKFQVDFKGLIEKAKGVKLLKGDIHWYDWKRYSTRQEEWMSLGGVTGTVTYEGDLSDFIQLLRLGEYVHVGKGTSFGLGKYEIYVE